MTFTTVVIVYCLVLITYISGKLVTDKIYQSNMTMFNQIVIEAYNYAKNVCGYELMSVDHKKQEKFLSEALIFIKNTYEDVIKEIDMYDDDKLCKVIVSKVLVEFKKEEKEPKPPN